MFKFIKKKIEKYIILIIEKHYKDKFLNIECRLSDHRRFIQANGEDISTLFKSIHVGADIHYKGRSWAVVCVEGKPNIVKFIDLGRDDYRRVLDFLRSYEQSRRVYNVPLGFNFEEWR